MESVTDPTEPPSRWRRLPFDRPAWPFDPRRVPFFYGWVAVLAATLTVLCSAPGQTIGVSVFTDDLMAVTGLTRVQISLTYLVGTLGGALLLPRAGRIYDRVGARTITVLTAAAFGGTLLILSQLDRCIALLRTVLWADALAVPVSFAVMGASFFALRFLGQGVLTIGPRNMVMKWFETRRGLATGVMGVLGAFGMSGSPVVFDALIDAWGWKGAWQILGFSILVGLTLLVTVLYRDNPQECGLLPDGHRTAPTGERRATGRDQSLAEARRTLAFWIFLMPLCMAALYGTALPFHVVSIFAEADLSRDAAISIFLPASVISVTVNFVGGWLSDRTSLRWHLLVFLGGMLVSNLGVLSLHTPWGRWILVAGTGLMGGMMTLLSTVTWPRYFGYRHLGAVSAFVLAATVAASAIGPTIFGYSLQFLGSYHPANWACIAGIVGLACLAPLAREPEPESDAAGA